MSIIRNIVKKIVKRNANSEEEHMEVEKLPYATGLIQDEPDSRDYLYQNIKGEKPDISKLPNKWDLSSEMSPVKSQMNLGACVAFATAAVREWQQKKEYLKERKEGSSYKRESAEYDLSESWIYWNCKKIDNFPDSEGTSIRSAMKVLNQLGVPKEKAWPYTDDKNNPGKPKPWSKLTSRWNKIKSYHRITSIEELVDYLYNHGPVVAGVLVFSTWGNPDSNGFVDMPPDWERPQGAHAIPIIGYDKSPDNDKDKKLFFKNSWGMWGNQGFGSISFDYWKQYALDCWAITDMDVKRSQLKGEYKELG